MGNVSGLVGPPLWSRSTIGLSCSAAKHHHVSTLASQSHYHGYRLLRYVKTESMLSPCITRLSVLTGSFLFTCACKVSKQKWVASSGGRISIAHCCKNTSGETMSLFLQNLLGLGLSSRALWLSAAVCQQSSKSVPSPNAPNRALRNAPQYI